MNLSDLNLDYASFISPDGDEVDGVLVSYAGLVKVICAEDERGLPSIFIVDDNEYGDPIAILKGGVNLLPHINELADSEEYETIVKFLEAHPEISLYNEEVINMKDLYDKEEDESYEDEDYDSDSNDYDEEDDY